MVKKPRNRKPRNGKPRKPRDYCTRNSNRFLEERRGRFVVGQGPAFWPQPLT